jgi:hypothetical protein
MIITKSLLKIIITSPVMGLRGGGKRGRSGADGTKKDKMQRIHDAKEEYQTLAVLIDPLIQNNVQLQSIVKQH